MLYLIARIFVPKGTAAFEMIQAEAAIPCTCLNPSSIWDEEILGALYLAWNVLRNGEARQWVLTMPGRFRKRHAHAAPPGRTSADRPARGRTTLVSRGRRAKPSLIGLAALEDPARVLHRHLVNLVLSHTALQ
jgi:hypothetical protein